MFGESEKSEIWSEKSELSEFAGFWICMDLRGGSAKNKRQYLKGGLQNKIPKRWQRGLWKEDLKIFGATLQSCAYFRHFRPILKIFWVFWDRGGSLPEILNYLPDGGQFSWVPLLIQIQVKFLFQVHVRQIVQFNWKWFFLFFYFFVSYKKGPQKAILGTATEACI